MVCGVWCVVCGVWCVVCGVWCVVCGVWCVVCGVWCSKNQDGKALEILTICGGIDPRNVIRKIPEMRKFKVRIKHHIIMKICIFLNTRRELKGLTWGVG